MRARAQEMTARILAFAFFWMGMAGCARCEETTGTTDPKAGKVYEGASEDLRLFRNEGSIVERLGIPREALANLSEEQLKQAEQLSEKIKSLGMVMATDRVFRMRNVSSEIP